MLSQHEDLLFAWKPPKMSLGLDDVDELGRTIWLRFAGRSNNNICFVDFI